MIKLMEKEGWKFEDQFGAGYIFSKEDTKLTITSRQYTGKYTIWNLKKKISYRNLIAYKVYVKIFKE